MNFTPAILLVPVVLLSASVGQAQSPTPDLPRAVRAESAGQPAPAEKAAPSPAAPDSSERGRMISPALSATLTRGLPAYAPPAKAPEPKAAEEVEEERPRNQIIRLPRVIVEGNRPPVFTERQVYTKEGLEALAVARYLSEFDRGVLNRFRLPFIGQTAEERAMTEYEEEERQRNIAEAKETIYILKDFDPEAAERLKNESQSTFIRRTEFLPSPTAGRK